MRHRLLSARPVVTRTSRRDPRGSQLETVAAEFALLAQRRARIARQLDLLARQLEAATNGLNTVQSRMSLLAHRMDHIDPGLWLAPDMAEPDIQPPPPTPLRGAAQQRQAFPRGNFVAAPHAQQEAPPPRPKPALPRPLRQLPRRRPFLPE